LALSEQEIADLLSPLNHDHQTWWIVRCVRKLLARFLVIQFTEVYLERIYLPRSWKGIYLLGVVSKHITYYGKLYINFWQANKLHNASGCSKTNWSTLHLQFSGIFIDCRTGTLNVLSKHLLKYATNKEHWAQKQSSEVFNTLDKWVELRLMATMWQ
jgi:hypothetical protein